MYGYNLLCMVTGVSRASPMSGNVTASTACFAASSTTCVAESDRFIEFETGPHRLLVNLTQILGDLKKNLRRSEKKKTGLDWTGLDWTGLDWIELVWTVHVDGLST